MSGFAAVVAVLVSLVAGATPAGQPETGPPPGHLVVSLVTVIGSGCRPGTVNVAPGTDNTALTVTYRNYVAAVGVGASPIDMRKNCQLGVRVDIPRGYTFAIGRADYRGLARLASGASGIQRAGYYFQGISQTAVSSHDFRGPYNRRWQATDSKPLTTLSFPPCGQSRILNINSSLIVNGGSSDTRTTRSFMRMDSNSLYHLQWRRC
ncbi:DUF4360 domain-containing protein [Actinoplanes sp. KI2]|uniref:DUF4360 domain-containing protein n=1 Tax=Actinoplanes sp. KI2 TaxID=2983315 RepID=UPI0021D5AA6C|nr:DUF4360 domain-containing protein [Actinoplanes sp. KI2]MCU7729907.1 DUF4360 domain-containing protein [Actinoplanes sp. KI2]